MTKCYLPPRSINKKQRKQTSGRTSAVPPLFANLLLLNRSQRSCGSNVQVPSENPAFRFVSRQVSAPL